ncbi:MAG: hypothetical protein FJ012_11125 [Chloroflexi bacterium]|nr:hypothetical protein [Chloroflexota bacterium]
MAAAADIREVRSREGLRKYLAEALGYCVTDVSYPPRQLDIPPKPSEAIQSVRMLSDYDRAFQAYLLETTSLTRTTIRAILEPFYRHHPAGDYLFVFTKDYSQLLFVSPLRILRPDKPMPALQLRILPLEPANVYHTDLEVLQGIALTPKDQRPEIIRKKHEQAFSVERVTDEFFKNYKLILNSLKERLAKQHKGISDQVHAFAQQFLNRLMFLYFLERKGWLKWSDGTPDRRYMRNLWRKYQEKSPRRGFYSTWLKPLFFYAFNKRTSLLPMELPADIRASFLGMPYLNGGLFTEDEVLGKLGLDLPDEVFTALFDCNIDGNYPGFLERYNFTIQESLPLEVEVAVDPEMLGRVYESLINEEDRHQAGIFYTPRIEIDYMCRLSLIEHLHEVTSLSKETLITIVMAPASEDGRKELARLTDSDVNRLRGALDSVRAVDPAVGSGSFLVGMMNVMVQLYRAIAEHRGLHENEFALKRQIISRNLYGVDVKDWAVRVCELRLWLSLIIESEESQMDIYNQPLLPNLTFKARQGDSLVEEIAGVPLSLRADYAHIPPSLKKQIHNIVDKKADHFRGDRSVSKHGIEQLEQELLLKIIDSKVESINNEIRKLESPQQKAFQAGLEQIRGGLDITGAVLKKQEEAQAKVQPQIDALKEERERWREVAASVGKKGEKDYFLWDIDFAEVFLEKEGFDICIGNPPYVRQEEIAPPLLKSEDYDPDRWREIKRGYKEQLERAVRTYWGNAVAKVDKKSDLYVYFYYQGLSLLRPGAVFCFINSNSWLDVGYGGSLQQFLLRNIDIHQVIDNHARRSFKESDINTVIVVLRRPKDGSWAARKDNVSKFIAYRVPFEAGVNAENLLLQEWTDSIQSVPEFRVYPIKQEELWRDGLEVSEEGEAPSLDIGTEYGKYSGGKWGGKYLRAPDIFFTILEKGKGKLVRLGDIAEVRRGFTTGANEFFYLEPTGKPAPKGLVHVKNGAGWEGFIEEEFLKPVAKSPKDIHSLLVDPINLAPRLFLCHRELTQLKGQYAGAYIVWGTARGYGDRPSCRGRTRWWDLGGEAAARLNCNYLLNDVMRFYLSTNGFHVGDNFLEIWGAEVITLALMLNSTVTQLLINLYGRSNFGGGLLKIQTYEVAKVECIHPKNVQVKVDAPLRK